MGNTLDKRKATDPRGERREVEEEEEKKNPQRESSESREAEQRGMLGQETIKTLDYPCCRKLGTRHKA